MVLRSCADSTTKKIPGHLSEMEGIGGFETMGVTSFPVMDIHLVLYIFMHVNQSNHSMSAVEKVVHVLARLPKVASIEALTESPLVQFVLEGLRHA